MKKILLPLVFLIAINNFTFSQNRILTRGTESGELYFIHPWYGIFGPPYYTPPYYDEVFAAVYRLTENGKKVTIQYAPDLLLPFSYPEKVMKVIHTDAVSGITYARGDYFKDLSGQLYSSFWVSFDYGKTWTLREDNTRATYFTGIYSADNHSIIYRMTAEGLFFSIDYGQSWTKENTGYNKNMSIEDIGFTECEFYGWWWYPDTLCYTQTCYNVFSKIEIDTLYKDNGAAAKVYRGSKEGEIYISYWAQGTTYEAIYKVLFSEDNGNTFRCVYENLWELPKTEFEYLPNFIPDREPGVFYIVHPTGIVIPYDRFYMKLCVYYYRDYGETLAAVYCHEFPKEYGDFCESVDNLSSIKLNNNSILLSWSEPARSLPVKGYTIFRDDQPLNIELITDTHYLDENLPAGSYEYYVRTHYEMDCISDSSNHVIETVELGINNVNDREGIILFPNPTTGELTITNCSPDRGKLSEANYELRITNVEIFDIVGRKQKAEGRKQNEIDISHLQSGFYFVKITTEKGIITKKIIKY